MAWWMYSELEKDRIGDVLVGVLAWRLVVLVVVWDKWLCCLMWQRFA